ncbi:U3 small nucleolar RNA-associated protein 6 homolog [Triticum dicoccoides]|uniref:U3 small nucleolar RNA-associated protein 6 homolog n=1 Tax=Triticum dicoccoides TaxID=85692 RepID=UPI000E789EA9|nr:U3 small nucleolar RNA-associated protein 6 homolog [Triticum dicoccoides]XP_037477338.1 U3 small nucleolar RNA-associated protein 6 homolog [Triticum dicoccoides]
MADTVQYRLERMSDELDDLERRGLFTRAELAEVVRRRRDFEFRLRRHSPRKADFLDYIAYLLRVDALRDLRKRAIIRATPNPTHSDEDNDTNEDGKKRKKRKKKWAKSISDFAGVLSVLDVYRMATVRFKGDLDLWFRYLEFCRQKGHGRMKQVMAQAIRYHPNVPGLWMYAAAWEFDQNLNVAAARALMQSGLRSCPESEDMWIEYLRMELTYLNKLKARKVALGEDVKTLQKSSDDSGQWKEENKELFMSLDEQGDSPKESGLEDVALEDKEDLFWQQGVLIIRTIYHGAMEALPSSLTLRKKILDILNSVELAHSEELRLEVMDDLKKDFSHNEDYWDWLARLQLSDSTNSSTLNRKEAVLDKLNKSIQVYDEAVRKLPTSKMYSLYANFWLGVVFSDREDSISLFHDADFDASEFTSAILKVFENAESCGCLSEDLACQYVSLCLKLGRSEEAPERLEEAKNLAEKLCSGPLSQAANLWNLRASIEIKSLATATGSASFSEENLSSLFDLFNIVLPKLSIAKAEGLWHTAMKLFSHEKIYFEKLVKCATLSLSSAGGSDCGASVSSAFVGWVLQKDGIKQARKMYKRFLALPRPSLKFFQFCIELEASLASIGNNDGLVNARKLYDSAISLYPQERELWRKYYNMELTAGTSETSNAIYWRARKVLNDSTALDIPRS